MMQTLFVELGTRRYPIFIGQGLLKQADILHPYIRSKQVMIVTNTTVAPLYLAQAQALFANYQVAQVILPDGEEFKNLTVLNHIFDALLQARFDRRCTLVALGGGVIGDMTGFAAACYQRGVAFLQIPTTLLAQVDSSVGGKTGVNHALGKNMIGAFHQPQAVLIDTDTLHTLPDRELSAGLAEVVKYGLIQDVVFFEWLVTHAAALLARDATALAEAIARSCQHKADIVVSDEHETGVRALLNLGHTFGHAVETGTGYTAYLHGEAVAIGMVLAAKMSQRLGWLEDVAVQRILNLLTIMRLPTSLPTTLAPDEIGELMKVDKKAQAGKIRLILLRALGEAIITDEYPADVLRMTLEEGYSV